MAVIAGNPSSPVSVTAAPATWWIKDPLDATGNVAVYIGSDAWQIESDEASETVQPIGTREQLVVADARVRSERLSLVLSFPTKAAYLAYETLRARQRTLLVQSPYGDSLYVRAVGKRTATRPLFAGKLWTSAVELVEVAAP